MTHWSKNDSSSFYNIHNKTNIFSSGFLFTTAGPDQEEVEQIVKTLTKITDSVHFLPTEIEADSGGEGGYFLSGWCLLLRYCTERKHSLKNSFVT